MRISQEPEIARAIRDAVHRALSSQDLIPDIRAPAPAIARNSGEDTDSGQRPVLSRSYLHEPGPSGVVSEPTHAGTTTTDRQLRQTELAAEEVHENPLPPLRVIGEFGGIYILATSDTGELFVIDQHAAHERILYEIASRQNTRERRVQELIAPVILHRTPRESAVLSGLLPALREEGFTIEEFGRDTFIVRTVPVVLGKLEDTSMLEDIISDIVSSERGSRVDNRERINPHRCLPRGDQGRDGLHAGAVPARGRPAPAHQDPVHLPPMVGQPLSGSRKPTLTRCLSAPDGAL